MKRESRREENTENIIKENKLELKEGADLEAEIESVGLE